MAQSDLSAPTVNEALSAYSDEAVQAILGKALELSSAKPYSAQQLQEMAAELNISPDVLAAAETDWQDRQANLALTQAAQEKRQRRRRQQWQQYALVSVFLVGLDLVTSGGLTWAIFPVMGWGLGLALDGSGLACHRD